MSMMRVLKQFQKQRERDYSNRMSQKSVTAARHDLDFTLTNDDERLIRQNVPQLDASLKIDPAKIKPVVGKNPRATRKFGAYKK